MIEKDKENYLCCPNCGEFIRTIYDIPYASENSIEYFECKCESECCKLQDAVKYNIYLRLKKLEKIINIK